MKHKLMVTLGVLVIWSLGFWFERVDLMMASVFLLALAIFVELPFTE